MRHFISLLAPIGLATLTGCAGSDGSSVDGAGSNYDGYFATPSGTSTPDSIFGLWGGATEQGPATLDLRMRIEETRVSFANRCKFADGSTITVGLEAAARVSNDKFQVLESKNQKASLGDKTCTAQSTPGESEPCPTDKFKAKQDCFELSGTTLRMYGKNPLLAVELTKLED